MVDPLQTDAELQADDETRFEALEAKSDHARLPGIHRAMWPGDVHFNTDLSEYNDRFIETNAGTEGTKFVLYLFSGWHTAALGIFVVWPIFELRLNLESLGFYLFTSIFPAIMFWIANYGLGRVGPVRFNRQAQVVHFAKRDKTALSLPWRDVRPYARFSTSSDLLLAFPIPRLYRQQMDAKRFKQRFRDRPLVLSGKLDRRDVGLPNNLMRLEFIRRYMEEGLSAVQPDPDLTPRKPTGDVMAPDNPDGSRSLGAHLLRGFYWFGLGPLVDRWVEYKANQFKWPEEVERLCAPGADLSGFDTTPVKPSTTVYYRYDFNWGTRGVYLCDARGERLKLPPDE